MGIIVNPRGAAGSGKTELVRRILAEYGWTGPHCPDAPGRFERLFRPGRGYPIGYRLRHPAGGRPLVVLGHYERTSGGCDTIRREDGGMAEVFRLAARHACFGSDVLIEGLHLSSDLERSLALARAHPLHVIHLETPPERSARNLARRRRAGSRDLSHFAAQVTAQKQQIARACEALRPHAEVHCLSFEDALARARELLRLPDRREPAAAADLQRAGVA